MKHVEITKNYSIGQKIKLLRKSKNWSQHEVANRLQISIPAFSKIEAGITTLTFSRLKQLGDVFGASLGDITTLQGEDERITHSRLATELRDKIAESEEEIAKLQRTAISLYEELEKRTK